MDFENMLAGGVDFIYAEHKLDGKTLILKPVKSFEQSDDIFKTALLLDTNQLDYLLWLFESVNNNSEGADKDFYIRNHAFMEALTHLRVLQYSEPVKESENDL